MLARGRGTIVDMASLAALAGPPGMYHYAGSKAARAAASESLRPEAKKRGVHVVTVYPGPVETAMAAAALARYERDPSTYLPMPIGKADALPRLVLRAVARRHPRVIYPRPYAFTRMFPGFARWVTDMFSPMPKRLGQQGLPPGGMASAGRAPAPAAILDRLAMTSIRVDAMAPATG